IVVDDGRKDPAGRGRWDRWRRRDPGRGRHLVGFPYRWERIAVTIEALNTSEHDPTRSCRQVGGEVITARRKVVTREDLQRGSFDRDALEGPRRRGRTAARERQ